MKGFKEWGKKRNFWHENKCIRSSVHTKLPALPNLAQALSLPCNLMYLQDTPTPTLHLSEASSILEDPFGLKWSA